jgi:hypothetical protein
VTIDLIDGIDIVAIDVAIDFVADILLWPVRRGITLSG